jgi:hypothetical protein
MNIESLKFPIGHFEQPETVTPEIFADWVKIIADFPKRLIEATDALTEQQLDTPYRPEGWTVRQVVHHCADSHLNSFVRFKLALTEDNPTIKPYFEERWALLPEVCCAVLVRWGARRWYGGGVVVAWWWRCVVVV